MKKVLLSLSFLFFGFFTSQVSFASFDCSFTQEQLKTMTPQQFDKLSQQGKVELSILYHAGLSDSGAGDLIRVLPTRTKMFLASYAEGVPPTMYNFVARERRSARGIALEMTMKAIAMGFAREVPIQVAKQLVGIYI